MAQWNPWHGCRKISTGCQNCYVYRIDTKHDKDASIITKNTNFNLPLKKSRNGSYKLESGDTIYTCFSSDFFIEDADDWRVEAWQMIRYRSDLHFFIITKRIERFAVNLPSDWSDGYDNVTIGTTCENQERANFRLPILHGLPLKHKTILCEPLLGPVDLSHWLNPSIEQVVAGGESGNEARVCHFDWVIDIRNQCMDKRVPFHFKQTGAKFVKDDRLYLIKRQYQHSQARRALIDYTG
jgi:protein gp37